MCFRPSGPDGRGGRGQTYTKTFFADSWGCGYKILLISVQGFRFPLALHIPTDKQTSVRPFLYRLIDRYLDDDGC